jgi:hypothetical protein
MNTVELLPVELRNAPVELWHESRRWFEELLREFAVISTSSPEADVPRQLLAFVDDVQTRFAEFRESANLTLEDAHAAGRGHVDLNLKLPSEAGGVAMGLYEHLLRADEVCREGHLLTIEMSESVKRFLGWYLGEIASQLEGSEPTPWDPSET